MNKELARCFIALELPREAIDYLEELQNQIRKKNLFYGKLTEPENLHLTLKFLGEMPEEKIKEVQERLRKIKIPSFEASLGELGFFSEKFIRILWIKINGKPVWDLQAAIDKSLEGLFPKEERFMSHLTIARIKKVPDRKMFLDYVKNTKTKKIKFDVREFILKKSELLPEGPVYTALEKYSLE
jgi:2'-5' RNA ligase